MSRTIVSAALLALTTAVVSGQNPAAPWVNWDKDGLVGGNRAVSATGTLRPDAGWKPVAAVLKVSPAKGGKVSEANTADFKAVGWGPLAVKELPKGEYFCYVVVTFRHETKGDRDHATPPKNVTVP